MTSRDFQDLLDSRVASAGVTLVDDIAIRLEAYYRLLATWNRRVNLTGLDLDVLTPGAIDRLLVEPLVAATHVSVAAPSLIDIGSGGGSPAVPLMLALKGSRMRMVESRTRKSVFLKEVIRALELDAEVITARFEELLTSAELNDSHDVLSIRAVRIDELLLGQLRALVKPTCFLFLFRSTATSETLDTSRSKLVVSDVHPLIDALDSKLVVLQRVEV